MISSPDLFCKNYYLNFSSEEELQKGYLYWGLGRDGDLYCKCSEFSKIDEWYHYSDVAITPSLVEMKRIVKAFGNLVLFT